MQGHEYKVIPAPSQGEKARGARSTEERMAVALTSAINAEARNGWEYVRSETLPTEERSGLTKRRTVYVNMLVFRRPAAQPAGTDTAAPARSIFRLGLSTGTPAVATPAKGGDTPATAPPVRLDQPSDGQPPRLGPAVDRAGVSD